MNLDQAASNLNQVLFTGRITMPTGPLTAQEHQELAGNFGLLVQRAKEVDELQKEVCELRGEIDELRRPACTPPPDAEVEGEQDG